MDSLSRIRARATGFCGLSLVMLVTGSLTSRIRAEFPHHSSRASSCRAVTGQHKSNVPSQDKKTPALTAEPQPDLWDRATAQRKPVPVDRVNAGKSPLAAPVPTILPPADARVWVASGVGERPVVIESHRSPAWPHAPPCGDLV